MLTLLVQSDHLLLRSRGVKEFNVSELPRIVQSYRTRLGLWENDHHLAHLGPRALLCGTGRHVPTPGPQ